MSDGPLKLFFTLEEAADFVCMKKAALLRMAKTRMIRASWPSLKPFEGAPVFARADLIAHMEMCSTNALGGGPTAEHALLPRRTALRVLTGSRAR
jgi:hypothetical protein